MALRIFLHLLTCGPGFESQAKHLCYFDIIFSENSIRKKYYTILTPPALVTKICCNLQNRRFCSETSLRIQVWFCCCWWRRINAVEKKVWRKMKWWEIGRQWFSSNLMVDGSKNFLNYKLEPNYINKNAQFTCLWEGKIMPLSMIN